MRIFLPLFIGFWLVLMVGCPGTYDSRRSAIAHKHYFDAPSDETRLDVAEAHRLDKRGILVSEVIMAAILAAAIYGFIRTGKKAESHGAC